MREVSFERVFVLFVFAALGLVNIFMPGGVGFLLAKPTRSPGHFRDEKQFASFRANQIRAQNLARGLNGRPLSVLVSSLESGTQLKRELTLVCQNPDSQEVFPLVFPPAHPDFQVLWQFCKQKRVNKRLGVKALDAQASDPTQLSSWLRFEPVSN